MQTPLALAIIEDQALNQSDPDNRIASTLWTTLAEVAQGQGQPQAIEQYARQALRLAEGVGYRQSQQVALRLLAQAQAAQHRPEAYATLARYLVLHDTLVNRNRTQAIATAQARFNDAGQQAQIRSLQQARRLAAQQQELTRLRTQRELAGIGGLGLLALLVAGGSFWQYRRRQAAAAVAAAAVLRQRLAADLHDDVGNLLTQISLQSGLLRESPLLPAPLLARVEALTGTARRATQQMSDAIWGLAATAPTLPELLRHMRDHAHEVLQPLGLEPRFDTHPAVAGLPLSIEARQALYLIFKEALHNVVKHAHPSKVVITLAPAHPGLALTVRNDGPAAAPVSARPEGQGLASMQARAQAVGGRVRFPAQAAGFVVESVVV